MPPNDLSYRHVCAAAAKVLIAHFHDTLEHSRDARVHLKTWRLTAKADLAGGIKPQRPSQMLRTR